MDKLPIRTIENPNAKPVIRKEAKGLDFYKIIFDQNAQVTKFSDEVKRQLELIGKKFSEIEDQAAGKIRQLTEGYDTQTQRSISALAATDNKLPQEDSIASRFPDVAFEQVDKLVAKSGSCRGLKEFQVRPDSFVDVLTDRGLEINNGLRNETKIVQTMMDKLLSPDSSSFWQEITNMNPHSTISEKTIEKSLGKVDPKFTKRISMVINHTIDPDLIPLTIRDLGINTHHAYPFMPSYFLDLLEGSATTRQGMTNLIVESLKDGKEPINAKAPKESLVAFIDLAKREYSELHPDDVVGAQEIDNYLQNQFLSRSDFNQMVSTIRRVTYDCYLSTPGLTPGWSLGRDALDLDIKKSILAKSGSLEIGKYLTRLYHKVDEIYKDNFTDLYISGVVTNITFSQPKDGEKEHQLDEGRVDDGNAWYDCRGGIGIISDRNLQAHSADDIFTKELAILGKDGTNELPRFVVDFISAMHETTHGVYGTRVLAKKNFETAPHHGIYSKTVDHAFNEGISTFIELSMVEMVINNPTKFGFTPAEKDYFEEYRDWRLKWLEENQNGYTQGYRIMSTLYKEAYDASGKDMKVGLSAVNKFLDSLDPEKTLKTSRDDPDYKDAYEKLDISRLQSMFQI